MTNLSPHISKTPASSVPKLEKGIHFYKVLASLKIDKKTQASILYTYRVIGPIFNGYSRIKCQFLYSHQSQKLDIIANQYLTFRIVPSPPLLVDSDKHSQYSIKLLKDGHKFMRIIDGFGITTEINPVWEEYTYRNNTVVRSLLTSKTFSLDNDGMQQCDDWVISQLKFCKTKYQISINL
jgi:hypothetical protein